jgi:D-alanine-D-alanine ligase
MQPATLNPRAGTVHIRRKLAITVLAGGPSAEREVSLKTGRAIADALARRDHDVLVADIGPDDLSALDHPADLIFPALHGTFGEDGTLQRILEQRGMRWVGSGSESSRTAMDKIASKQHARQLGCYTPPCQVVTRDDLERRTARLPMPLVAKPVAEGSSIATFIIREREKLGPAVRKIIETFDQALVERFIEGDELTVGILGTTPLPPICIRPKREFYDFEAKYEDDATEYLFDAGYPQGLLDDVSEKSVEIYKSIGCRHLARVDWIVDRRQRPWFLEINTLPGFTSHSLVPMAAARAGIDFDELVERLAFMAMEDDA